MKQFYTILMILFLFGCADPKIDGSSEEQLKSSIEDVKQSLDAEKQKEFEESLMFIAMQNLDFGNILQSDMNPDQLVEDYLNQVKDEIDGKSASEIITKAEELRTELEREQRRQALEEIQELEEKKKEADLAKQELSNFEVSRSRFYKQEDTFRDQPVIELTVRNNTEYAISRAYFKGTYATPERQVPWLVEEFNYSISGGLEPGEEQSWSLAPNPYSEWGDLEERSDAILTIEVTRLDGPDGEALFDAQGLSSFEEERLNELKSKYFDSDEL
ncbi:DUF6694 family lipoprotein [Gracilimonas amylolytica]|uniref:DUF6694 family lipoprotein n=1 Tax=Gracilimonas amylolytica TaxID=1749045 RepID=UPI000CD97F3E|nr:DUF6694 family lipoprotein [Gracilimonas amylolytica]